MMVERFRKKPIEVEAVQLTWANWDAICEFVPRPWFIEGTFLDADGKASREFTGNNAIGLKMQTLESEEFLAVENDWIIRGVKGEFYPCKPAIFEATYERVDDCASLP